MWLQKCDFETTGLEKLAQMNNNNERTGVCVACTGSREDVRREKVCDGKCS